MTINADRKYIPLEQVTRTVIPTDEAAHYLNRSPQTLRLWARNKNSPVQPVKIHGKFAWPVKSIMAVLDGDL